MRKRTTPKQLQQAITDGLLVVIKAETYDKESGRTEMIDSDTFKESLDYFCKSGIFPDAVGWHYEKSIDSGRYTAECGRKSSDSETAVTVHMKAGDGVSGESIDIALSVTEEE